MNHSALHRLALLFVSSLPVFSQPVTVGVTGAVPVTETLNNSGGPEEFSYRSGTVRYNIGPAVDFRIIGPFRAEIDALYQPFSLRTFCECNAIPTYGHTTGALWQFPALLKFRLPSPVLKPFVDAGPSFQLASNIANSSYTIIQPTPVTTHPSPTAAAGFAIGGGFEFHARPLIFAPEIRCTHWFGVNLDQGPGTGTNANQIQILLSIRI
jgi:hypothetical protein